MFAVVVLEELAVGDDSEVRHVPCQPSLEFHGRVNDWVAEIRELRERGETVLFVAASHGRAERTVEILREYEVVAVPVEDVEAVHAVTVLVGVGSLSRGFRLADASLQIYAETDVFEEERRPAEDPACAPHGGTSFPRVENPSLFRLVRRISGGPGPRGP